MELSYHNKIDKSKINHEVKPNPMMVLHQLRMQQHLLKAELQIIADPFLAIEAVSMWMGLLKQLSKQ